MLTSHVPHRSCNSDRNVSPTWTLLAATVGRWSSSPGRGAHHSASARGRGHALWGRLPVAWFLIGRRLRGLSGRRPRTAGPEVPRSSLDTTEAGKSMTWKYVTAVSFTKRGWCTCTWGLKSTQSAETLHKATYFWIATSWRINVSSHWSA